MLSLYQSVLAFTIFVLVLTAIYVGRHYPKPGTLPMMLALIAVVFWDLGYLLSLGAEGLSTKIFWTKFQYLGYEFVPPLWFLVIWRYTQHRIRNHRSLLLIFALPLLTIAFAWTNQFHGLLWQEAAVHGHLGISVLETGRGPWWLVDTLYSYSLISGGVYLLLRDTIGLPSIYKKQALVLLAGVLVPMAGNLSYLMGLTHHLDLAPLTFSITGLVFAWGVSRYRLFGVVPVARSKLLDEMNLGTLVMDKEGLLLSVNPAACSVLGCGQADIGEPIDELLVDHPKLLDYLRRREKTQEEVAISTGGETSYFDFKLTPLESERGYTSGWLAQFYEITSRVQAEQRLRKVTIETMEALAKTVEAKDAYTREHLDRVEKHALAVAERLDISEKRREQLRFAAVLHDIGKVRVPDGILNKQDGLTDEEYDQIKDHAEAGESIVGQVSYLQQAATIIGQHHEKFDGSGYPKGLKGDEITLEARILSVVDAYDAMRSDRPYRDALPREVAIKELKENKGTQFDPEVVDILLEMIEAREAELE
ncbi:HD domain-containing protein [Candidatus Bipolaricaulota bacterium]|nr:HD domain-containing protein [Candidatus Bipolaricaulota bacterium]